jgi:hypothetical protein
LAEATTKLGRCQVRSKTDLPCPRQATTVIGSVPFCEQCAREQESYFAIGELTEGMQGLRNESLVEELVRMRREREFRTAAADKKPAKATVGVPK